MNVRRFDTKPYSISSEHISVVIQGPLFRQHAEGDLIVKAIASLREQLPKAEIIVSTWTDQDVTGLAADKVILTDQPESFVDVNGQQNNVLRQIVSTCRGIELATRAYVLKFRADHQLMNTTMMLVNDYPEHFTQEKRLFKQPITITNLFLSDPLKKPLLFHISDLIQFGKKEDIQDFWSVHLPNREDIFSSYPPRFRFFGQFIGFTTMQKVPEQYLMLSFLKKRGYSIHLNEISETSLSLLKQWEQFLVDHFTVLDWQRSGIRFPVRFQQSPHSHMIYTEAQLQAIRLLLTKKYCYWIRYFKLLLNKYIFCWFNRYYLRCFGSQALFYLSPKIANRLRSFVKAVRKMKNKN